MLSKIESDDTIGKYLLKARKVESYIEQRKILGIKSSMSYDAIGQYGNKKGTDPRVNAKAKIKDVAMGVVTHKVEMVEIVSFVEPNTHQESVLHMNKHILNAMEKSILQKFASLDANHRVRIRVKVKDNQGLKAKIEISMKFYSMTLMMKVNTMFMLEQNKSMIWQTRGIRFESHWGKFPFLSLEVFQKNIYIYFQ